MTPFSADSFLIVLTAVAPLTAAAAVYDVVARTVSNGWCAAIALTGLGDRLMDQRFPLNLQRAPLSSSSTLSAGA
jgi:hypothetical protein